LIVRVFLSAAAGLASVLVLQHALAFPIEGVNTSLPVGTELDDDAVDQPREQFHSEAIEGQKSYLVKLGNMAFNTPAILGGTALKGDVSCGTCHINGSSNGKLFIPGLSIRPGSFDTTSALFNPKAERISFSIRFGFRACAARVISRLTASTAERNRCAILSAP